MIWWKPYCLFGPGWARLGHYIVVCMPQIRPGRCFAGQSPQGLQSWLLLAHCQPLERSSSLPAFRTTFGYVLSLTSCCAQSQVQQTRQQTFTTGQPIHGANRQCQDPTTPLPRACLTLATTDPPACTNSSAVTPAQTRQPPSCYSCRMAASAATATAASARAATGGPSPLAAPRAGLSGEEAPLHRTTAA